VWCVYEESMASITCPLLALADYTHRHTGVRGQASKDAAATWIKTGGRQANAKFVSSSNMVAKIASQVVSSRRVTEVKYAKELLGGAFNA
jgi:hypothetical protein